MCVAITYKASWRHNSQQLTQTNNPEVADDDGMKTSKPHQYVNAKGFHYTMMIFIIVHIHMGKCEMCAISQSDLKWIWYDKIQCRHFSERNNYQQINAWCQRAYRLLTDDWINLKN